jgi:uncharacterized membrane protein
MGYYHPLIVHFAIALLVVGVVFRLISLLGRPAFLGPAAATLLLLGTVAAALAVRSGDAAHGPVERTPGAAAAVVEHEDWGVRARNIFFGVVGIELVALALWRSPRRKVFHAAAGLIGVVGLWALYQAGDHGGRLVYGYAGGVGIRSGDPQDVQRLLLAGLYHQAQLDRRQGRGADAAILMEEAVRRFPSDPEVQLLRAESLLLDRKDPALALSAIKDLKIPADSRPLRIRHGMLMADALEAVGQRDAAAALLQPLVAEFPNSSRLQQRLKALTSAASPGRP